MLFFFIKFKFRWGPGDENEVDPSLENNGYNFKVVINTYCFNMIPYLSKKKSCIMKGDDQKAGGVRRHIAAQQRQLTTCGTTYICSICCNTWKTGFTQIMA